VSAVPQADPGSTGPQGRAGRPHIVGLQDATAQPWRNGGGVTRELLTWSAPEGLVHDGAARHGRDASAAGWDLRVSVADITQDGPFSAFPGISRCFAVLEGAGVVLNLREQDQTLTAASEPLAFEGAEAPGCRLVSGPTRDLNLMVRQSAGRAWMRRAQDGQRSPLAAGWIWQGLYTHGPALLDAPGGRFELPAGTLAWRDGTGVDLCEAAAAAAWCLVEGHQAWWLGLQAPGPEEDRT
jgi:environmental stress-induced protein Ves